MREVLTSFRRCTGDGLWTSDSKLVETQNEDCLWLCLRKGYETMLPMGWIRGPIKEENSLTRETQPAAAPTLPMTRIDAACSTHANALFSLRRRLHPSAHARIASFPKAKQPCSWAVPAGEPVGFARFMCRNSMRHNALRLSTKEELNGLWQCTERTR
jgi:hypothetical protein